MRVHANRDSALVLAAQASKAVPKITTIPELKGIHMEADARLAMLTMTATNQEVSIRASMPAAVEESGSAVIPADLLPDILKRLPGDQVSFSTVGPGIIHIGSGYAEYRLNILDAAKYPLPEVLSGRHHPGQRDMLPGPPDLVRGRGRRPTKYS